ncbi:hypothetical protein QR685DRAFT_510485 [Neurospora intermedia]|uniref:Uncharacterized protein n=1 Tax=Neurospora intermedia TaxID=5142 RepID=A0ABR3DPT2_NEUIN
MFSQSLVIRHGTLKFFSAYPILCACKVPFGIVDSLELHKPVIPLGSPRPQYPGNSDRPESQFMLGPRPNTRPGCSR